MPPTSVGSLGGSLPCWADSCSSAWDIDISSCRYVMPVPDLSIACTLIETLCISGARVYPTLVSDYCPATGGMQQTMSTSCHDMTACCASTMRGARKSLRASAIMVVAGVQYLDEGKGGCASACTPRHGSCVRGRLLVPRGANLQRLASSCALFHQYRG